MSVELFAVMLAEDTIMRESLQEIWELGQDPKWKDKENADPTLMLVFDIVDGAVNKLNQLTEARREH